MNEIVRKKQQARLAYLNKLYELTNGSIEKSKNGCEVASQIGLKNSEVA
jgi:hypothetical protein